MRPPIDEPNRETAKSARGRFPIRLRLLSFLSATWCGFVLFVLPAGWTGNSGVTYYKTFLSTSDTVPLTVDLCVGGFFAFVLGVAFGRFLLRAMPPQLFGPARRRQIAIIAIASIALIGFLILGLSFTALALIEVVPDHAGQAAGCAGFLIILWAIGAVAPVFLRHSSPRAFLERPFVLFLRRFSTFSDRTVIALILRQAKNGVPVVFLTPTHSRPKDWDPFVVGFAGLKLLHPLRSVPIVLRARDDDWQRAAAELIGHAQTILVDTSEGSTALKTEAEMIEKAGRWLDTVCLRQTSPTAGSGRHSLGAFSTVRYINYAKSWARAFPRLAISLPLTLMTASFMQSFVSRLALYLPPVIYLSVLWLVFVAVALMSYSIFWRPAVSRSVKIALRKVLRGGTSSLPVNRSIP